MKLIRTLLLSLAGLFVILIVIGLFLPSKVHVERSIIINAPPARVFDLLNGFERFNEWSPWYPQDPDAMYTLSGPAKGVGAHYAWQSEHPNVGSGSQEIIALEQDKRIQVSLDFGAQGVALASYEIQPVEGGASQLTWSMDAEFGFDIPGRYFGLMFDQWVGSDYEKGLASLKRLLESEPATALPPAVPPSSNDNEPAENS